MFFVNYLFLKEKKNLLLEILLVFVKNFNELIFNSKNKNLFLYLNKEKFQIWK